jgi:glycosyltransferase involved in cell wall biosynthesis
MPELSVVMSVYKGERFLGQAVDSILAQTLTDFEFIVVDDGSTDRTPEILQGYDDARLRVVTHDHRGLIDSLNKAIAKGSGDYIARMDADDISSPRRLELQLESLRRRPALKALGTQVVEIDESGRSIRRHHYPTKSEEIERTLLRGGTALCHGSMMFRRDCFLEAGGYRRAFPHAEDYDLWLRLIESYEVENLPDLLYSKRLNLESVSFDNFLTQQRSAVHALECARRRRAGLPEAETPLEEHPPTAQEMADYHWHLGLAFVDLGQTNRARVEFRSAISQNRSDPYLWWCYLVSFLGRSASRTVFRLARRAAFAMPSIQKDSLRSFSR